MEGPLPASSTPTCRASMAAPTELIPSKLLLRDSKKGKYDVITLRSRSMGPIWPFKKKKPSKSKVSRTNYMRNVVEYEKKSGKKEGREDDKSHLKNKQFLNAMKLLSKDEDED
jgi:hypothetical protein